LFQDECCYNDKMEKNSILRIPLYIQVREELRDELAALAPEAAIPPESRLGERFAVSRITIRRAIDDLVTEGLLVRQQGRGTFRQTPKLVHELNAITSWTDQLKDLGYVPHTAAQELAEIPAPKKIAQLMQIQPDERIIQLRRTRLANNEPITLMVNYIPSKIVPGFIESGLQTESLYEFLSAHYGLSPTQATDTVETRPASETESERLKIEPWSPVLVVTRVAQLEDGKPFEVAVAVSRGDRYEYRVTLKSGNKVHPTQPD
jgi:GntR family transcriptional regulator